MLHEDIKLYKLPQPGTFHIQNSLFRQKRINQPKVPPPCERRDSSEPSEDDAPNASGDVLSQSIEHRGVGSARQHHRAIGDYVLEHDSSFGRRWRGVRRL